MSDQAPTRISLASRIFYYPITRMILGLVAVLGVMILLQAGTSWLLKLLEVGSELRSVILSIQAPMVALLVYYFVYRYYEKRTITELSISSLPRSLSTGVALGIGLQSLVILVIYALGGYHIVSINPVSYILPGLLIAITSGILEELMFRGIVFRIIDERWGAAIALTVSALLFGIIHLMNKNSSIYSALAIAIEAGILLGACYMYSRDLWLPIGVHFGWNFAEADLYGGVLSGNEIHKTLVTAKFSGSVYLTGGDFGPENSLPSIIICTAAGLVLLWLVYRRKSEAVQY